MNIFVFKSKIAMIHGKDVLDAGTTFVVADSVVYIREPNETDSFHQKTSIDENIFLTNHFQRIY